MHNDPLFNYPDADEVRNILVQRVDGYCRVSGILPYQLSLEVMGDSTFVDRVRKGASFSLKSYDKIMSHIDREIRRAAASSWQELTNGG